MPQLYQLVYVLISDIADYALWYLGIAFARKIVYKKP